MVQEKVRIRETFIRGNFGWKKNNELLNYNQSFPPVEERSDYSDIYDEFPSFMLEHASNFQKNIIPSYREEDIDLRLEIKIIHQKLDLLIKGMQCVINKEENDSIQKKQPLQIPVKSLIILGTCITIGSILMVIGDFPFNIIATGALACPGYLHGRKFLNWIKTRNDEKK